MNNQFKKQLVPTMALAMLLAVFSLAQGWPLFSDGTIKFWVDGTAFAGDGGRTWQEIYWSLPVKDFVIKQNAGQRTISYKTVIQLRDFSGKLFLNEDWISNLNVPTVQEIERRDLAIQDLIVANNLNPGDYSLKFMVSDLNGGNIGTLDREINVPFLNPGNPSISQIQVASDIYLDSAKTRFTKGKLQIKPHPSREFGEAYGNLYYYFEVYRPVLDTIGKGRFVQISLNSTSQPVINNIANNDITERNGQIIQTGGVNLDSFPDGLYILKARLKDGAGKLLAYSQAGIKINRKSLTEITGVGDKLEEEIQALLKEGGEYFYEIGYIAASREVEQLKKLDESGKKEFLRRFWNSRDADPATPENEALLEHARRYKSADIKFGEKNRGGMKGSLTDRGRLYIKYGIPNEVESKTMQGQFRPVEIWRYYNGNKFVFVDKSSFGRFQLMYSKSKDERTDPTWGKYISPDVIQNEDLK
ncbi:GWxTD domain-containing protein [candidate division TA06 bacterium]|uniref:GWxTD domain-containing protein n=1 Tax=candidate division TA06 bacterium TaxID=2250710 RepID=A0A933IDL5_UNCT6|nr:GWxTD domain-containing protein [candidate division TA06 bacterium]